MEDNENSPMVKKDQSSYDDLGNSYSKLKKLPRDI